MEEPRYPTDEDTELVCKIGQGADCCRYLALHSDGWSCEKHTLNGRYLDLRVLTETINARGDNCDGLAARGASPR